MRRRLKNWGSSLGLVVGLTGFAFGLYSSAQSTAREEALVQFEAEWQRADSLWYEQDRREDQWVRSTLKAIRADLDTLKLRD